MAFYNPAFGPHPGQYFVPGSPFAGQPVYPGLPYPTYPRYGNTVYKYHTPDGGPPNMGAPPTKPKDGGLGFGWSAGGAFGNPPFASGFGVPAPPPPPDISREYDSNHQHDESCHVKGNQAHSTSKQHVNIRVFQNNILLDNRLGADGTVKVHGRSRVEPWRICPDTTIEELIEKIECVQRANYHESHRPYPRYGIGIQEVFPEGNGRFRTGTKITLEDPKACLRIGDLWPNATDNTPESRLPYLVRLPETLSARCCPF